MLVVFCLLLLEVVREGEEEGEGDEFFLVMGKFKFSLQLPLLSPELSKVEEEEVAAEVISDNMKREIIYFLMLPLALLTSSQKSPVLVEVKSGETFNGTLVRCDIWMNLHLEDVIRTSADGEKFWKIPQTFIRGVAVKYVRLPEESLNNAKAINKKMSDLRRANNPDKNSNRGGAGGRGNTKRGRGSNIRRGVSSKQSSN